jgi:hypothetical protein
MVVMRTKLGKYLAKAINEHGMKSLASLKLNNYPPDHYVWAARYDAGHLHAMMQVLDIMEAAEKIYLQTDDEEV